MKNVNTKTPNAIFLTTNSKTHARFGENRPVSFIWYNSFALVAQCGVIELGEHPIAISQKFVQQQ